MQFIPWLSHKKGSDMPSPTSTMLFEVGSFFSGASELGSVSAANALQRERALTCGFVASGGDVFFASAKDKSRSVTDAQFDSALTPRTDVSAFQAKLAALRSSADDTVPSGVRLIWSSANDTGASGDGRGRALDFMKIYSGFNALIAEMLEAQEEARGMVEHAAFKAFARLKEISGQERAFVVGALALPAAGLHFLPARAFSDLVLGLETQHACEAIVRTTAPTHLVPLLAAAFEMPQLQRELHNKLQAGVFVTAIDALRERLSAVDCWIAYSEVLEAIEQAQQVLQNEEQRRSAGSLHGGGAYDLGATVRQAAEAIADPASDVDVSLVSALLDAVPAETLKAEVKRALAQRLTERRGPSEGALGVLSSALGASQKLPKPKGQALSPRSALSNLRDGSSAALSMQGSSSKPLAISTDELTVAAAEQIPLEALAFERVIGTGGEANIYLATYRGASVAIKVASGACVPSWRREAALLTRISHPNLLGCIGVIYEPPTFGLVLSSTARGAT